MSVSCIQPDTSGLVDIQDEVGLRQNRDRQRTSARANKPPVGLLQPDEPPDTVDARATQTLQASCCAKKAPVVNDAIDGPVQFFTFESA